MPVPAEPQDGTKVGPRRLKRHFMALTFGLLAAAALLLPAAAPFADSHRTADGASAISNSTSAASGQFEGLRRDDIERAIWLIEDMAQLFGRVAETGSNRYAQASWRVLLDNYVTVGEQLSTLLADGRIKFADLQLGTAAATRGDSIMIDGQFDGLWTPAAIATARRIGGDDWSFIGRLASVLVAQEAALSNAAERQWFKDQLRRSGVFGGQETAPQSGLEREVVRFGFLKDKYLLAAILAETAETPELQSRWRARQEMVAQEADELLLAHAAEFGQDSALALARAWREYVESARQVSNAADLGGVTLIAPVGLSANSGDTADSRSAKGVLAGLDPDLRAALLPDMPERIKALPAAPAVPAEVAASKPAAGPMPDDQGSARWRDELGQRDYRTGGITVPIVSALPEALRASGTAGATPEQDANAPGPAGQVSQAPATSVSDGPVNAESAPAATPSQPESWLAQLVSRNAMLFTLLPFIVLLGLIVLAAVSLLAAGRRQRAAEEPIILSVAIDDDAPDLALDDDALDTPHYGKAANDRATTESAVDRLIADLNAAERRAWAETKRAAAASLSALHTGKESTSPSAEKRAPELLQLRHSVAADSHIDVRDLVSNLRGQNLQGFEALLSRLTGLARGDAQTLLARDNEAQFAVACRALELDELLFASLFMLVRRHYHDEAEVSPHRLSHALEAFANVTPEDAKQQLESFGVDADFTMVEDMPGRSSAVG